MGFALRASPGTMAQVKRSARLARQPATGAMPAMEGAMHVFLGTMAQVTWSARGAILTALCATKMMANAQRASPDTISQVAFSARSATNPAWVDVAPHQERAIHALTTITNPTPSVWRARQPATGAMSTMERAMHVIPGTMAQVKRRARLAMLPVISATKKLGSALNAAQDNTLMAKSARCATKVATGAKGQGARTVSNATQQAAI